MKKRILITGITGFLGEEMARHLNPKEFDIFGLARMSVNTRSSIGILPPHIKVLYGDLMSSLSVKKIVKEVKPHIIIHYAALSQVNYSFFHPEEVIDTNFLGTVRLAEAARECQNFEKFVFASTIEVYGDQDKREPYTEELKSRPNCPYAVSKVACEKYLQYLHRAFGFPCVIVRQSNVYGRKKDPYFIVEKIISEIIKNEDLIYLGSPEPVRSFIYIKDLLSLEEKIIKSDKKEILGEIFNTGPANGISIRELYELIKRLMGWEGGVVWQQTEVRPGKGEVWYLNVSNEKAKRMLNWQPKYTLEEGLKETIRFWKIKYGEI